MADQPASERTEEATPHRLQKARQEGKIAQSQDVPTAMMLAVLLGVLVLSAPTIFHWMAAEVRAGLDFRYTGPLNTGGWLELMHRGGVQCLKVMAPFLIGGCAVSVAAPLLMGGWMVHPKAIKFDLGRINPVKGIKNLISKKSFMKMLGSMVKLGVLLWLVWDYLHDKAAFCMALMSVSPLETVYGIAELVRGLLVRIVLAVCAIALFDLLYQRNSYKKELRMTKQEIKEEFKQYEINPHVKGRIRSIQREMARKRMLQAVPTADVVVTNPTHFAVALKYDSSSMDAPQVVAKGADLLCQRIKDLAREHNVPILERPPLARTLYASCEVGQSVPETLFVAVAEILAMIYRLRKQRQGS